MRFTTLEYLKTSMISYKSSHIDSRYCDSFVSLMVILFISIVPLVFHISILVTCTRMSLALSNCIPYFCLQSLPFLALLVVCVSPCTLKAILSMNPSTNFSILRSLYCNTCTNIGWSSAHCSVYLGALKYEVIHAQLDIPSCEKAAYSIWFASTFTTFSYCIDISHW